MNTRAILLVLSLPAIALLAGCKPTTAQTRLDLPSGFYASALAYDSRLEQYVIGSYQTGDIMALLTGGQPLMRLRKGAPEGRASGSAEPVTRIALDDNARAVWVALPGAIEIIDRQTLATRRIDIPGAFISDLAVSGEGVAFALDTKRGRLLRVDSARGTVAASIALDDAAVPATQDVSRAAASFTVAERIAQGGALALMPGRRSLLIGVGNGTLWRVDTAALRSSRVPLSTGKSGSLQGISQLLVVGGDARAYRVVAFAGMANRMHELDIARDFSVAGVVGTAATLDTPLRAAWDGRRVQVLLGSLRHHPDLHGDGRPSMPARMVSYLPFDHSLRTASASAGSATGTR